MSRRGPRVPSLLVLLASLALAPAGGEETPMGVEHLFTLPANPVSLAHAGDGSGRLFVVLQPGMIAVWDGDRLPPEPFLDIRDRVGAEEPEQGLLGLAFHPDFPDVELFYVDYTDTAGDTVVSSFGLLSPNVADPDSESPVLTVDQPAANHNGGNLLFGPDGLLYVGMGDGGASGPDDRGQDLTLLLGKMLRIDVDGDDFPEDPEANYAVPADNPFVADPDARDEIWAWGLRNPWRFSFDRDTGDLFIGDVGQNRIEEIDFQAAASAGGENYGWELMEGSLCFDPPTDCNDGTLVLPILEYGHFDDGFDCSVAGGYRYRGELEPMLDGLYVYGDYCSGKIWAAVEEQTGWRALDPITPGGLSVVAFGEDEAGELHVASVSGDAVYRLFDTRPFCEVEPDRTSYADGDTVVAERLRLANRASPATTARFVVAFRDPSGDSTKLVDRGADGSFQVPSGTDRDLGPRDLFTVGAGTESGEWTLLCRLLDPATGAVLAADDAAFEVE